MSDEHEYAILYDAKDDWWDENEMRIVGDGNGLANYILAARRLKEEGHRNVRVVEFVTVTKEVMRV